MKKVSGLSVILYALCAVIWTFRVILDLANQTYSHSVFLFVLNILCAVVWSAGFIVNLKRYRSKKDE